MNELQTLYLSARQLRHPPIHPPVLPHISPHCKNKKQTNKKPATTASLCPPLQGVRRVACWSSTVFCLKHKDAHTTRLSTLMLVTDF